MLTNTRNYSLDTYEEIDFIHNYYERLVLQEILTQSQRAKNGDRDFLADVACVALNRMPPRYIRHDVDMTFFMSPQDIEEINHKVIQAVTQALHYVESRERGEDVKLPAADVSPVTNRTGKSVKAGTKTDDGSSEKKTTKSKSKK